MEKIIRAPILNDIRNKLKEILEDPKLPPDCALRCAVTYALNEMDDLERNSLFFGSHAGAERHAIFYSLACSCRNLGIDFRQYITDTLNAAAKLPPTASTETWRELLPDRYSRHINN